MACLKKIRGIAFFGSLSAASYSRQKYSSEETTHLTSHFSYTTDWSITTTMTT